MPKAYQTIPIKERLMKFIDKSRDCWVWTGSKTPLGYGQMTVGSMVDNTRRNTMAHIVAYETFTQSKIPKGMTVDHICRNKSCVNPAHLEIVTYSVNCLRRDKANRKTHCKHGHEYVEGSYYLYGRKRKCKACNYANNVRNRKRITT